MRPHTSKVQAAQNSFFSTINVCEFSLWCSFVHYCRPIFSVLADSDEESSSADSSDEEEQLVPDPQGTVGEKGSTAPTDG